VERINPAPALVPTSIPAALGGICLSRSRVMVALVVGVVALALAFGGGLWIGYSMGSAAQANSKLP
jgi:hypothetical protein